MFTAQRIRNLPQYIFAQIDQDIQHLRRAGKTVINLGISDPNQAPRPEVVRALQAGANLEDSHRYPSTQGSPDLRRQVADWYRQRFGVRLDPEREVLITVGSKEALIHLSLAVVDPEGVILVPDPGYPAYSMPHALFGMEHVRVVLDRRHGFLSSLSGVHAGTLERAQLLYANYPNNPTGAVADRGFWRDLVEQARRWDFVIC